MCRVHTSSLSFGDLFSGDGGRERVQTRTLCVLEASLGLPCAVRARNEEMPPAYYGENLHVPQSSSKRPRLPSPWGMEPTPSLPTSLLPQEMVLWGLLFLLQSPEAAGSVMDVGAVRRERPSS